MPDIKTKAKMQSPKVRKHSTMPREAKVILMKRYSEKRKRAQDHQESPVPYAVDQMEQAGGNSVFLGMDSLYHMKRHKSRRVGRSGARNHFEQQGSAENVQTDKRNHDQKERLEHEVSRPQGSGRLKNAPRNLARRDLSEKKTAAHHTGRAADIKLKEKPLTTRGPMGSYFSARKDSMERTKEYQKKLQFISERKARIQNVRRGRTALGEVVQRTKTVLRQFTAKNTISMIWVAAPVLIALLAIAGVTAVVASPFGILFANENVTSETVSVPVAVAQIQQRFDAILEQLQCEAEYDGVVVHGNIPDWVEVLAVFAVHVAGADGVDVADVITMDVHRVDRLESVFTDMCNVSHWVETIEHSDTDPEDELDDSWTEHILHIQLTPRTAEDMKIVYRFTMDQETMLDELFEQRPLLEQVLMNLSVSDQEAQLIWNTG